VNDTNVQVWVLADDRPGNRGQVLGVAEALGLPFAVKEIRYGPLGGLPNFLLGASFAGLSRDSRNELAPPWPDIVLGAGRRVASVARTIKRLSGGHTFAVQIMDPGRFARRDLDLIAVPHHDRAPPGPNVFFIAGAPHRIRPDTLAQAAEAWRSRLAHLPKPLIAVLIGGGAKGRALEGAAMEDLAARLEAFARRAGGSLLITSSRRTEPAALTTLLARVSVPRHVHRWGDAGENPYLGFLALADAVVVTGDSMSMCSEACASGAPVYIFARDEFVTPKYARLHRELYDLGFARPLTDQATAGRKDGPRLNAADAVAAEIRKRRTR
jgi:mitochondrial fission protein ELM1